MNIQKIFNETQKGIAQIMNGPLECSSGSIIVVLMLILNNLAHQALSNVRIICKGEAKLAGNGIQCNIKKDFLLEIDAQDLKSERSG